MGDSSDPVAFARDQFQAVVDGRAQQLENALKGFSKDVAATLSGDQFTGLASVTNALDPSQGQGRS